MRLIRTCLPVLGALALAVPLRAADLLPPTRSIPEVVDHYIDRQHKEQSIQPAGLADDATLLRRLTLDLAGRIPTVAELQAYTSDKDPNKKTKLVERLMASGAFIRHQVAEFDTMLAAPQPNRRGGGGNLREYLTAAFKENRSWDRIFQDLIRADEKEPVQKGSAQFLKARVKDLDRLTTDVSVLFFGVNISCAQCHDHPLVHDWKQDHFYGLKSFFNRTYEAGPFLGERDGGLVQFKTTKGATRTASLMFLTGKVVADPQAKASAGAVTKGRTPPKRQQRGKAPSTPPPPPKFSARSALAELALQSDQRSFFARNLVNRLWHRLFGLGLVTPIDQLHSENVPSHPDLLAWLARDTAEHGYDLRRLIRGLVLSNAYARSSHSEGDRFPPMRSFAVARLRALTPMQLAVSLRLATTSADQFPATLKADELDRKLEQLENAARGFASLIEYPRDDFQISVTEAMLFSNNDRIQREFLDEGKDRLLGKVKEARDPEQAIELSVRQILTRAASAEEKKAMLDYLAQRRDRLPEAYRQMVWALLTSAEFRFNH